MPALTEVSSRDARKQRRWVLDTVMTGDSDVAISRHGKEIAVIIPVELLEFIDHPSFSANIDMPSTARNNGKGKIQAKPPHYLLDNHLCGYRSK